MADDDLSWLADLFPDMGSGDLAFDLFDTETGQLVDPSMVNMADVQDLDLSGSGSGPVGEVQGPQPYDWEAASAGETGPGEATPGQIAATAPYNASSGTPWLSALAKGLGSALGGLGGGLGGLVGAGGPTGMGGPIGGGSASLMSTPGAGQAGEAGGLPGLAGLIRASMEGGPDAALLRGQADPGAKLGLQAPIDAGPAPTKFVPLQMPLPGGAAPMAGVAPPRLSGLQKLMAERLG